MEAARVQAAATTAVTLLLAVLVLLQIDEPPGELVLRDVELPTVLCRAPLLLLPLAV